MDWQQIISLLIVALAAFLLVRSEVKRRRRASLRACGNDCGCTSEALERIKAEARTQAR